MWCHREGDRATQIFSLAGRSCPGVLRGLYSGRETGNPPQWVTPLSSAHSFLHSRVQYSVVSSSVLSSLPSGMFPVLFRSLLFPPFLVYSHLTLSLFFVVFSKVKLSISVSSHTSTSSHPRVLVLIFIVIFPMCYVVPSLMPRITSHALLCSGPFPSSVQFLLSLLLVMLSYPLFFLLSNHLSVFLSWQVPFESCLSMYMR